MIVPVKYRVMPFDQGSNTEDWFGTFNLNKESQDENNR